MFDNTDYSRIPTPWEAPVFFYELNMCIPWSSFRESLIGGTDCVFVEEAVCSIER